MCGLEFDFPFGMIDFCGLVFGVLLNEVRTVSAYGRGPLLAFGLMVGDFAGDTEILLAGFTGLEAMFRASDK